MSKEWISRELARLHKETTEEFDKRTIAACQARNYGTRPGPDDKPKRRDIVKDETGEIK